MSFKCIPLHAAAGALAFALILTAVFTAPARAQLKQQLDLCASETVTPDVSIGGCTAAIQSGKLTKKFQARAFLNRGLGYAHKNDYDRAIADFSQAVSLDPNEADAFGNRGIAYELKKDYAHAITDYDQAIRLDPKNAEALYNRSLAKRAQGDKAGAAADLAAAKRINPKIER